MDCPRCRLVNPPDAKRCDCGYDFETKTVEASYSPQALPKDVETSLIVLIAWNALVALLAFATRDVYRVLGAVAWMTLVWVLYSRLLKRSNAARIALAVLTFPIGTAFFLSTETRLYCLQAAGKQ